MACTAQAEKLDVLVIKPLYQQIEPGRVALSNTTSTYTLIEKSQFENKYQNLSALIEHEAGVQTRASGGIGGFSSISLRGASSEQVSVYLDGVALNQASGGSVDLSLISLDEVERIEVFRGTVPIELSHASLGGAVNIISKKSATNLQSLKASLASFNTQAYNYSKHITGNKSRFFFSASALKSDNDFEFTNNNGTPLNSTDDRREKRFNNKLAQYSIMSGYNQVLENDRAIHLRFSYLTKNKQLPDRQNNPLSQAYFSTDDIDIVTQIALRDLFGASTEANFKLFMHVKDELFNDELSQLDNLNKKINMNSKKIGGEAFSLLHLADSQIKYRLLIEHESFEFEDELNDVLTRNNDRSFIDQGLEYKTFFYDQRLIFNASVRHMQAQDKIDLTQDVFGNAVAIADKNQNQVDYQLGMKYRINASSFVNLNYAHYARLPSFFELFGDLAYFRGNPDLLSETGVNTELGFLYTIYQPYHWWHDASIYMAIFNNKVNDLIARDYNSNGIGVSKNIANINIQGLELSIKLYPDALSVIFNATFLHSINASELAAYDGRRLPGQFEQDYSLHLSYPALSLLIAMDWDVKKTMYYDRANLLQAPDVSDLSLSLLKKWQKSSLEFSVKNLLDKEFMDFNYQPVAGIAYHLTYKQNF